VTQRRWIGAAAIALPVALGVTGLALSAPALAPATPQEAWSAILDGPPRYLVPLEDDQLVVLHLVCGHSPTCPWTPHWEDERDLWLGGHAYALGIVGDAEVERRRDLAAWGPTEQAGWRARTPLLFAWSAGVLPPASARGLQHLRAARLADWTSPPSLPYFHDPGPVIEAGLGRLVRATVTARLANHRAAAALEGLVAGLVTLLLAWPRRPGTSSRWPAARAGAAGLVLLLPWSLGFHQGELEAPAPSGLPETPYVAFLRGPVQALIGGSEPRGPLPLAGLAPSLHDGPVWFSARGAPTPPRLQYLVLGPLCGLALFGAARLWWRLLLVPPRGPIKSEVARALLLSVPALFLAVVFLRTGLGRQLLDYPGDLPGDLFGSRRLAALGTVSVAATLVVLAVRLSKRQMPESTASASSGVSTMR
jgi:hypothetical protein